MATTRTHLLVMAKAPVPGRVKTRLCPPCDPVEAASIAAAALADTLAAVARCGASRRIVALDGEPGGWLPPGFEVIAQKGATFERRLEAAWAEAGGPGVQIGMDTPQVTAQLLDAALARLDDPGCDAVLGPALDGGWWAVGFGRPRPGAFRGVPMSTGRTGVAQLGRLRELGLRVSLLPPLRDLDTLDDARVISAQLPGSNTAEAVAAVAGAPTP